MYKLNPEKQISVNKETLAKILSMYSIFEFNFEPINEGIANTSFVIKNATKKYVLRIYAQGKDTEEIILEIKFQDYLRDKQIPIPLIYYNQEGKELTLVENKELQWQCILMEFIEGQSITTHPSKELNKELASLQAKMHILGVSFLDTTDKPRKLWVDLHDSLAEKIKEVPVNNNEVLEFIERVKSFSYPLDPKLPYGYNHLDIDFDGNVITRNNRISGIVDFEDLKYSPTIVCLGFTLWNILDDKGIDAVIEYLNEYGKIRPLTSLEWEALPHVIFFRNYVMGIVRLLLWQKDTDIADITDILQLEKEIPKLKFSKTI